MAKCKALTGSAVKWLTIAVDISWFISLLLLMGVASLHVYIRLGASSEDNSICYCFIFLLNILPFRCVVSCRSSDSLLDADVCAVCCRDARGLRAPRHRVGAQVWQLMGYVALGQRKWTLNHLCCRLLYTTSHKSGATFFATITLSFLENRNE